ncbi:MAG TPA: DUF6265 family protein [Candidatus Limnocylindria bacterium]|jgi:hypothetical protein|nr:DUF6265 family protein [Candidatus Limnocylindria bacterium]
MDVAEVGYPTQPIRADIQALAWVSGRWVGSHGADTIEEQWSAAAGGGMMGMFRAITDSHPRFYELITFDPEGEGLVCRFKHFNRDLSGWEEKDEALTLDLVALTETDAVFLRRGAERWMTYRRAAADRLVVFFENAEDGHDPDDEYRFDRG